MTDHEVMQMALDALTIFREWEMGQDYNSNRETVLARAFKAEEILSAALAQGEQEPMAWMCPDDPDRETAFSWQSGHCVDCGKQKVPLYTAPPQREWKSLTEEDIWNADEIMAANSECGASFETLRELVHAIESKLKEKNT